MVSTDSIKDGWYFMSKILGADTMVQMGTNYDKYIPEVSRAIDQLAENINKNAGTAQDPSRLKGFIAEYWHAGTFNIDAAIKESSSKAFVEGSNKHASVDVSTNFGQNYSMKYYGSGEKSAEQQAKNVFAAYNEYRRKSKSASPLTFEEYLEKYGYSEKMEELLASVYVGQGRIIPADQWKSAISYLDTQIKIEASKTGPNRALVLANYRETLENLKTQIISDDGVASRPLKRDEAEAIAALCKEGIFDPADFGISLKELISDEYIVSQALQAGYTSAVLTLAMHLAPELFKAFDYLIRNGEIDLLQLKTVGVKSISATAEGFLRGSISAGITIACKAGKMGPALVSVNPHVVGAVTVLALDAVKSSLMVAMGKMTPKEMGVQLSKEIIISGFALTSGSIAQTLLPQLPVLGYTLGSFLGSIVASVSIDICQKYVISYCVNTGFTLFGLVEQDYELPDDVLKEIGLEVFDGEQFVTEIFGGEEFVDGDFDSEEFEQDFLELTFLRRGVIGVRKIGYV